MEATVAASASEVPATILAAKVDFYNGVTVDATALPHDASSFDSVLSASLAHWKKEGKRGVWLGIPIALSHLIPTAAKHGFVFHSAEPASVMMTRWLPDNETCLLPDGASHTVGVGGFVYNAEKRELLVIREKYIPTGMAPFYKLPGGYVKAGEALGLAAEREVEEETGIKAEFQGIITFRHMHPHLFSNSDIYFVALLKPLSFATSRQEEEIEEVLWMPIDEYRTHPSVNAVNQRIASLFVESLGQGRPALGLETIELTSDWMKAKTFHDLYTLRNTDDAAKEKN